MPTKPTSRGKSAPTDPAARNYTAYWARFWGVTKQAVRDWLKRDGMPLPHDVAAMLAWAATPGKKPRGFLAKVAELRAVGAKRGPDFVDPDWKAFVDSRPSGASADPLEEARDYYQQKLRRANASAEENAIRIYSDLVIKYEKAIRDNKLAAEKLGIEVGQLIHRTEIERVAFATAFWLMRSTNEHLDPLVTRIDSIFPGIDKLALRSVLKEELLADRFLIPIARATRIESGVSLPAWYVAAMRRACGDFLHDGEKAFDEETAPRN